MDFKPNWASAPGNTINEILVHKNIPISKFTKEMGRDLNYVEELLNGKISINKKIASQLKQVLGASEEFWINRERQYRESLNRIGELWLKELPIKDMINFGWIEKTDNLLMSCLDFFGVSDIKSWKNKYSKEIGGLSFRTSKSFKSDAVSVAAWLRRGELITQDLKCNPWNKDLFIDKLDEIKKLTRVKSPSIFVPKLIKLCAECGVAVAIVPTPKGCRASGATKFIRKDRALLLLSFRYLSDDHFWFTFFHEAGHLVLHENNDAVYIEMANKLDRVYNQKEEDANVFAAEALVPFTMHSQLKTLRSNKRKIIQFAQAAGISPGIVVGQMQYLGYIKQEYLNSYKRRYNWNEINSINFYE